MYVLENGMSNRTVFRFMFIKLTLVYLRTKLEIVRDQLQSLSSLIVKYSHQKTQNLNCSLFFYPNRIFIFVNIVKHLNDNDLSIMR